MPKNLCGKMFSENLLLFFILLMYLNVDAEILHDTIHEENDEHDHSNHGNEHEIQNNQIHRKNLVKRLIEITRPESQRKQEFLQIHDLKNVLTSLDIYDCDLMGDKLCKTVSNVIPILNQCFTLF